MIKAVLELELAEAALERMQGDTNERATGRMLRDVAPVLTRWLEAEFGRVKSREDTAAVLVAAGRLASLAIGLATIAACDSPENTAKVRQAMLKSIADAMP